MLETQMNVTVFLGRKRRYLGEGRPTDTTDMFYKTHSSKFTLLYYNAITHSTASTRRRLMIFVYHPFKFDFAPSDYFILLHMN